MHEILLVDDHPAVMEGTKVILEQEGNFNVTTTDCGTYALQLLLDRSFDLLLIDLNMPGLNGIDLAKEILGQVPNITVLIYSGYDIQPHFNQLVEAGISGFVPKTAPKRKLVTAIYCAINGDTVLPTSLFKELRRANGGGEGSGIGVVSIPLNERELAILKNLAQGNSNKQMAEVLFTSQRTLEYSLTQLFHKLNVKTRKEAVTKAKQLGILSSEDFM